MSFSNNIESKTKLSDIFKFIRNNKLMFISNMIVRSFIVGIIYYFIQIFIYLNDVYVLVYVYFSLHKFISYFTYRIMCFLFNNESKVKLYEYSVITNGYSLTLYISRVFIIYFLNLDTYILETYNSNILYMNSPSNTRDKYIEDYEQEQTFYGEGSFGEDEFCYMHNGKKVNYKPLEAKKNNIVKKNLLEDNGFKFVKDSKYEEKNPRYIELSTEFLEEKLGYGKSTKEFKVKKNEYLKQMKDIGIKHTEYFKCSVDGYYPITTIKAAISKHFSQTIDYDVKNTLCEYVPDIDFFSIKGISTLYKEMVDEPNNEDKVKDLYTTLFNRYFRIEDNNKVSHEISTKSGKADCEIYSYDDNTKQ